MQENESISYERPNEKNSYRPKNMVTLIVVARKTITPSEFRALPPTSSLVTYPKTYGLAGERRTVMKRVTLEEPKNKGSV